MKKLYLVTLMLILTGLLVIGCSNKKPDLTKGKTSEQIIKAVIEKSHQIKNYSFEAYLHTQSDTVIGGEVSSALPSVEFYKFYNGNHTQNVFSIYMKGSSIYIQSAKNTWGPVQENIIDRGTMEFYLNQALAANPSTILSDIYQNRIKINRLKDEMVEGKNTTVIEIVYDIAKAGRNNFNLDKNSDGESAKMTLWVGKNDLLVYRYYTEGTMEINNVKTGLTITTNISRYDMTKIVMPEEIKKMQVKL